MYLNSASGNADQASNTEIENDMETLNSSRQSLAAGFLTNVEPFAQVFISEAGSYKYVGKWETCTALHPRTCTACTLALVEDSWL